MAFDKPNRHVYPDAEALAAAACEWLVRKAAASSGPFSVCLSGGSTPKRLFELLASAPHNSMFPWDRVHWFWGDERVVPADHPDSNARMTRIAMLDRVPVAAKYIHAIPTEGEDPDRLAARYAAELQDFYGAHALDPGRPLFDVVLLGIGDDGHTASLFPGSPALAERSSWAAAVTGFRPEPRITLTYPVLESARDVAFLAAGKGKRDILAAIGRGEDFPAGRVKPVGALHWFLDEAAAR